MTLHNYIKLFEEKRIRAVWYKNKDKCYFSKVNVVIVLTDSVNSTEAMVKFC